MELLLGLLFTLLLVICAVPWVLLFLAVFAILPLPIWLESALTGILSLMGGLVGQAAVIDVLNGARSWRGLPDGSAGVTAFLGLHVLGAAGGAVVAWGAATALGLPVWLQQVMAAGGGGGTLLGVMVVRIPGFREEVFARRPLATRFWEALSAVVAVLWIFGPPAALTLLQEGRIRSDSQVDWPHMLLMGVGVACALLFHSCLEGWLRRHRGIEIWEGS